jgi:hypothetical protein
VDLEEEARQDLRYAQNVMQVSALLQVHHRLAMYHVRRVIAAPPERSAHNVLQILIKQLQARAHVNSVPEELKAVKEVQAARLVPRIITETTREVVALHVVQACIEIKTEYTRTLRILYHAVSVLLVQKVLEGGRARLVMKMNGVLKEQAHANVV